jgi:hypothetical protein
MTHSSPSEHTPDQMDILDVNIDELLGVTPYNIKPGSVYFNFAIDLNRLPGDTDQVFAR